MKHGANSAYPSLSEFLRNKRISQPRYEIFFFEAEKFFSNMKIYPGEIRSSALVFANGKLFIRVLRSINYVR